MKASLAMKPRPPSPALTKERAVRRRDASPGISWALTIGTRQLAARRPQLKNPTIIRTPPMNPFSRACSTLLVAASLSACYSPAPHVSATEPADREAPSLTPVPQPEPTRAVDLRRVSDLDAILPALATKRVVFVGEVHDRLDHHINQLEIIEGLHARNDDLVIGMEFFQQPFQRYLDEYIAGTLDEREMLRKTEYYQRWRFDFRLYAPILRYAREQGIPLLALNIPAEITGKVARGGLSSLSESERAQIPADLDRTDAAYRERLKAVFDQHPRGTAASFDNFLDAQLLWDEGMAERAARYLQEHPSRSMVVLAGEAHLAYRSGIPERLARRLPVDYAVVLQYRGGPLEPNVADYMLFAEEQSLPPAGTMGIHLSSNAVGGLEVTSLSSESGAKTAGLEVGDIIQQLDGLSVESLSDVRLAMWDKRPGDTVSVQIKRSGWLTGEKAMILDVPLR